MNPPASTALCRPPGSELAATAEPCGPEELAERTWLQLQGRLETLDGVVREELRRAFVGECGELIEEAQAAARVFRRLRVEVGRRLIWGGLIAAALWSAMALLGLSWLLPSPAQLRALQARRDQLQADVRLLTSQRGRLQLARCGRQQQLCVRVNRRAPAYGDAGDYLIVAGEP